MAHQKKGDKPKRRKVPRAAWKAPSDEEARAAFLDALISSGNVTDACRVANLPRKTAYNWRYADENFAKAWDEAQELGTDALEDEAIRRGRDGFLKPVFQGGREVGQVREYSDTLLIFMLKARRPDKFKDRVSNEVTGKDGSPIGIAASEIDKLSVEQCKRIVEDALRAASEGAAVREVPGAS